MKYILYEYYHVYILFIFILGFTLLEGLNEPSHISFNSYHKSPWHPMDNRLSGVKKPVWMLWEEKNICPDEDQTLMPQLSSTQSKSLY
jgi:hypothetical protein